MCFVRNKRISQPFNHSDSYREASLFYLREGWVPLPLPCSGNSAVKWWKWMQCSLFRTINHYLLSFQKQARCVRSDSDTRSGIPRPLRSVLVRRQLWTQQLGSVQHFHSGAGTWSHLLVTRKMKKRIKPMFLWGQTTEMLYLQL